jgi:hypothetical protein
MRLFDLCSYDSSVEGNDACWVVITARLIRADDSDACAIKIADPVDNLRDSFTMKPERRGGW